MVPGDNRQHVRHEALVALIEARVRFLAGVEGAARRRVEVDHAAAAIAAVARRRHAELGGVDATLALDWRHLEVHVASNRAGSRAPRRHGRPLIGMRGGRDERHHRERSGQPDAEQTRCSHQNQYASCAAR